MPHKKRLTLHEKATAYYDQLASEHEYTPFHQYFEEDYVYSDGYILHLDVIEVHHEAPTLIMIPGTALYSMVYSEAMYKISQEGYNVIGLDLRGHGRSQGTRGDYTISELIVDVQNTISFALRRFNNQISILGSSQGGIVAFYTAAIEDRIQSAICQNFADLGHKDNVYLTRYPNLYSFIKPIVLNLTSPLFSDTQVPVNTYLKLEGIKLKRWADAMEFIQQDPLALKTISLRALSSLAYTPLDKRIEQIETPIMVFQGDKDTIFPVEYTQSIYDQIKSDKHFEIFPGLNHALLTENTAEVVIPIVKWLDNIYPNRLSKKKLKANKLLPRLDLELK